jgi:AAA family ATP:ADP antiporter
MKNEDANKKAIRKKEKPSFAESLALLTNDKNLRSVAMMVIGYNICIELTEVLWKGILRKVHTTEASYMNYMASFSTKVRCF